MTIKHAFQSAKADGGDTSLVRPSNWNADHAIDNGTVALPSIAPASDPNTGLYFDGADRLYIATGGVQSVAINTAKAELEVKTSIGFTPAAPMLATFGDNVNTFAQVGIQNLSTGTSASSDLVLTTDTGTDAAEYIDLGINGSAYVGTWGAAKDGYLYVEGGASGTGNLVIGTQQPNTTVDIQVGGGAAANRVVRFDSSGLLLTDIAAEPSNPPTGFLSFYANDLGGRLIPKWKTVDGKSFSTQPLMGASNICSWQANPNNTSLVGMGVTLSSTGTATATAATTTSFYTRQKRTRWVSAATAGSLCGPRIATAVTTMPSGAGLGGFFFVARFGVEDAAAVSGARTFVGLTGSSAAPTNVEPSTLTNAIGIGNGAADTNLRIFYGGSAAQASIDLGVNFPATTRSTDFYELVLHTPLNANNICHYTVTRLNTGHVASGTLTGTAGTALPASTTTLTGLQAWRTNNATALAVTLSLGLSYLEIFG